MDIVDMEKSDVITGSGCTPEKKTRQNSRAYNKALKKFQLWDTQAVHNWEDCKQLLGLPMTDSITGSCVRFRNLGDTLGPEELSYVEQHRASVAVIPYENNYNFLVPLESYNNDWNEFDDMLLALGDKLSELEEAGVEKVYVLRKRGRR